MVVLWTGQACGRMGQLSWTSSKGCNLHWRQPTELLEIRAARLQWHQKGAQMRFWDRQASARLKI